MNNHLIAESTPLAADQDPMTPQSRLTEYISEYPFLTKLYHTNPVIYRSLTEAAHRELDSISMLQFVMEKQSEYVEEIIKKEMMRSNPAFTA